ncbi:HAD family hydrolase [Psychromonas sp. RZ22]|uniref:HAD-IA family hydrolase n=1 Tax=Psychromonas algarum TaxID=2555643 RepID=UPI0010676D10|nr:HAD-IA family hydrolase [Psychromonas sp. RZ22]TEW56109.1 HAD family hydrolase [Psychromonas sp. RZ22]
MKYKLIIFDWDGTLMDSVDKIVLCMQQAAQQQKQTIPTAQAVKNIVGLSLLKAMQQLFPDLSLSQQQDLVEAYREQYLLHQHLNTPLYDGIFELLIDLKAKGYTLAVATGKGRNGLDSMLQITNTSTLFAATICADEANSKPDPLMINLLLDKLNIASSDTLMVGDSSYDLDMATNAGVKSLGVSYGVHDPEMLLLSNPIAIVDCLATQLHPHI